MDEDERLSPLRDALLTIPGVWAALILAGFAGLRLQPSLAGAAVSIGVCLILLLVWGAWTGPGRRTHFAVYLLAGLLYWALCIALFLTVPTEVMTGALQWLTAGTVVGYQYAGGPHAPVEYSILAMVLNLFGPLVVMGLLRRLLPRRRGAG